MATRQHQVKADPTGGPGGRVGHRRSRWLVGGLVVCGFAALLVASARSSPASAQTEPEAALIFERQCAGCHGAEAEGGVGPDLRTWAGSVEDTAVLIAQGSGTMPGFAATMTAEQIDALAAYLDRLVASSSYRSNCAACHGEFGEGAAAPSLLTSGLTVDERRAALVDGFGGMPGFGDRLDAEEIDALLLRTAGYAAVGGRVFAAQCAACHGSAGEGGSGPPLAGTDLSAEAATAIVEAGFGSMPAFGPTLGPGEAAAVAAYLQRLEAASATTTTTSATTTTSSTTTSSTTTSSTTTTVAGAEVSGSDVYAAHCALCHGDDTEGGIGPPLLGTTLTLEELRAVIEAGQGSMPGFGGFLSDDEVTALVDYLERVSGTSSTVPTGVGADVYAEQCAACHGEDGEGGIGPSLRATLLRGADLRAAIAAGNATMPAFGRSLSPDDLERVARYVESLADTEVSSGDALGGGPAIYAQDCAACHGSEGEGGIGPALGGTRLTVNEIIARVYGGHSAGMPAFEGALDGRQVREVAEYVITFPEPAAGGGITWVLVAVIAVGTMTAATVVGWALLRARRRAPGEPS